MPHTGPGPLIVIDGPAGAGKTTVARRLAERLGADLLDTGAIYRSLAWMADKEGVNWDEETALVSLLKNFPLRFEPPVAAGQRQRVFVGDQEVTAEIRTPHISEGASRVSALPGVRAGLLERQRALAAQSVAAGRGCVAEGRDMGTVVFPDADHKFFLTASSAVRAQRRHAELGAAESGQASLSAVAADMQRRDERDSNRAVAPLRAAEDAVEVDSSGLEIDAVLGLVLGRIRQRRPDLDGHP